MDPDIILWICNTLKRETAQTEWDRHETVGELLKVACEIWALPKDRKYVLVNARTGKTLNPEKSFRHWSYRDGQRLDLREASYVRPSMGPSKSSGSLLTYHG